MKTMRVMKKTSTVVMEDRHSSATCLARPAPPREVHFRRNSSVGRAEDVDRGGKRPFCRDERLPMPLPPHHTKRRREEGHCRDNVDDAYHASKKKHAAAEPEARVSNNRSRPTANASCEKEETNARGGAAARREIRNRNDGAGGRRSQGRAPMISRLCVSPPAPATPAARPDSLTAQEALSAAIARAHQAQHMRREVLLRREEARRELAKMVRTVEFNDPYISPMDALKP